MDKRRTENILNARKNCFEENLKAYVSPEELLRKEQEEKQRLADIETKRRSNDPVEIEVIIDNSFFTED